MFSQPFFVPASILLLVALPLILGLIPPNRIYGVRTVETMADKSLWYQVNRYGGWALVVSSLIYLGIAWIFPSVVAGETDLGRWALHLGAFAGPLLISLLLIRSYVRKS
jgi:hypothetical protein